MSRIGKIPVDVPKEIKAQVNKGNVLLESSKGKLNIDIPVGIRVEFKDEKLNVTRASHTKQNKANHGTIRAVLANMVVGLTKGYKKELEIQGIGFRVQLQGKTLVFNLGFSHPVEYVIPDDVKAMAPTQTSIIVEGSDKIRVGQIAAKIRGLKPVEPYKGKGIRYVGEIVRRKQGKSVAK